MGSQTLDILRQGVWASLTGGYFYDPHQGVFCNVVHLYLWLFLLCSPFVAYLYFPGTWVTWCIYCVLTSLTILLVKLANMALHRLYDRAQSMSESNLKNQFFKVTKETEPRDDETGIEMKVLGANGSRASVDHAINEASEENSMLSIENVNSIIDLKVDVHRKNSSESIELMFYAPSLLSGSSQQDQQSLAGSTSVSKSIRSAVFNAASAAGAANTNAASEMLTKYLTVYPEHTEDIPVYRSTNSHNNSASQQTNSHNNSSNQQQRQTTHLSFKCPDGFSRHHHRRRLERQRSLDATSEAHFSAKLMRNQSDTLASAPTTTLTGGAGTAAAARNETFLHSQKSVTTSTAPHQQQQSQRFVTTNASGMKKSNAGGGGGGGAMKSTRLQRHRSSETHDERLKQQQRNLFLPIHHEQLHHPHHHQLHHASSSGASSIGALAVIGGGIMDADEMELGLGGSSGGVADTHVRALQSWMLGSSSDVYLEDDSYTKSDLGIEQLDVRTSSNASRAAFLLQQQKQLNSHYQHQKQYRNGSNSIGGTHQLQQHHQHMHHHHLLLHHLHHHHGGGANIRKDSASTMSALQLSVAAPVTSSSSGKSSGGGGGMKRRRHSNATTSFFKSGVNASTNAVCGSSSAAAAAAAALHASGQQTVTVRRIKSAALEIPCPQPSVSNLSPHPNSVEAINGQQQIRNPQSALLPPPSKCLVRNQHLNLCPRFSTADSSFGNDSSSTCSSLNFGAPSACGSTTALIDPVYPIVELADEKTSLDMANDELQIDDIDDRHERVVDQDDTDEDLNVPNNTIEDFLVEHVLDDNADNDDEEIAGGDDDDDELDDVPVRRRHKALGCSQTHHSAESDVGGILADNDDDDDDDVFKDFDSVNLNLEHILNEQQQTLNQMHNDVFKDFDSVNLNLEHILNELQQTQNQLDNDLKTQDEHQKQLKQQQQQQQRQQQEEIDDDDDEQQLRETGDDDDEETDNNNGSRSPLLSGRNWSQKKKTKSEREKSAEKAVRIEIIAAHQQQQQQQQPKHAAANREADSGCPSSDCEQISASSKDQLLAGMESAPHENNHHKHDMAATTTICALEQQPIQASNKQASKSLGAIPKVVKYREIDEIHNAANNECTTSAPTAQALHKRRSAQQQQAQLQDQQLDLTYKRALVSLSNVAKTHHQGTTTHSQDSSTNSSQRSISADSFSADIHKMLWLMHGGAVDERGRPIAGIAADGTPIPANPNIVPPNMSSAHFQFYQDAIQALHTSCPQATSIERLSERNYYRDMLRRDYKQQQQQQQLQLLSEPHALDLSAPSTTVATATGTSSIVQRNYASNLIPFSQLGVSTSAPPATQRIAANALSIEGLCNTIRPCNDERALVAAAARNAGISSGGAAIIVDTAGIGAAGGSSSSGGAGGGIGISNSNATITGGVGGGSISVGVGGSGVAILNVDGHHCEPYCDYWRPACLLTAEKPIIQKSFYKYRFKCCGYEHEFKISMDRLELLALFDRDLHWFHIMLSFVLCTMVAYLGADILQHGYYKDLMAFLFCAVIASAQYSLVKSVQPDAASPIHGFNKTVAYSRAIYFCLCSGLLLMLKQWDEEYTKPPETSSVTIPHTITTTATTTAMTRTAQKINRELIFFGITYSPAGLTSILLEFMYVVLLIFPLIFSLGLFPQVNTFLMYSLEQIDMHVFGGNAAGSLLGSFICVLRSILGVMLLYGPLYAALDDGKGTQYIVFSIFCALLIPLGYHLSRSASDFSHIWRLIKTCIMSTYRDDDDELSATTASGGVGRVGGVGGGTTRSVGSKSLNASGSVDSDQKMIATSTPKRRLKQQRNTINTTTTTTTATATAPISTSKQRRRRRRTSSNENIELSSMEKFSTNADGDYDDAEANQADLVDDEIHKSRLSTLGSKRKAITASSSFASGVGSAVRGPNASTTALEIIDAVASSTTIMNENDTNITDLDDHDHDDERNDDAVVNSRVHDVNDDIDNDNLCNTITATANAKNSNSNCDYVCHDEDDVGDADADDKESNITTTNPADVSALTATGGNTPATYSCTTQTNINFNNNALPSTTATTASVTAAPPVTAAGVVNLTNPIANDSNTDADVPDPLPRKLQVTVNTRLKNDFVVTILLAVCVLGLHCSTVFTVLQPDLNIVLYAFTGALGLLLHYIIPQMRKHMPWLCFARPMLRQREFGQFEVSHAPKVMWFEKVYIYLCLIERNVLFPLLVISALTADAQVIAEKFGVPWGTLIVAICALKFVRNAYSDPTNQYLIVIFTVLFFRIDFAMASETFLIDYFFVSLLFRKCCDFLLKLQFIVTYIAPWQITWGSAFHAFAQPFSVPHSAMLFLQAAISALLSTPLNPFLGSAIFLTSYVRPIKFWERDYNTRRIDHSNTRLSSQLERDLGADDNNLNSIFYEHLTRSLQHSLCGDLLMGRWGNVNQGDCFVLASDYLNCLVHIIELGNGLCTFQMRGLEFRGTYCQQREVEAITEDVEDNDGCCCCDPGHLPRILSANAMFSTRWLAWQVVAAQYVLEGYSISDNLASATLQVFEYRKVLITYYIKSIIYYVVKNPKLEQWLSNAAIQDALQHTLSRQFVDLDPIFNYNLDEDFDFRAVGITRSSFCYVYLSWINYCVDKRKEMQQQNQTKSSNTKDTNLNTNTGGNFYNNTGAHGTSVTISAAASATLNTTSSAPPAASVQASTTATSTGGSGGAYNDSKSTPNLSTQTATKSQSQQQLRPVGGGGGSARAQKSATMSGSVTVTNSSGNNNQHHHHHHLHNNSSTELMSSSHSFMNISRQTSESAPGLSGAGLSLGGYVANYIDGGNGNAIPVAAAGGSSGGVGFNASSILISSSGKSTTATSTKPLDKVNREKDSPRQFSDGRTIGGSAGGVTIGGGVDMTKNQQQQQQQQQQQPVLKIKVASVAKDAPLVSLCLALGLLARRSLATASHSSLTGVEFFLHGLHALFKGDFRITSPRDEWVFADMELLHSVVAPAVKMALKLQQDHISNPDEFLDPHALYDAIDTCSKELVISHEADPVWRSAVLRGAPNLLALRHVMEDGSDEYRIIRLTKRFLSFRVIKLNRECVRGLWAGQQQELIYLRNRNPERGSIQNAKQALRNIINSSCDQPIGYPIYVSPLTTSYADTNEQLREVIGGAITLESIKANVFHWWQRIRERCRQGCSSGSALEASNLVGGCNFGSGGSAVGGGSTVGGGTLAGIGGSVGGLGGIGESNNELAPVYISAPLYNTLTVNNFFGVRSGNVVSGIGSGVGTAGGGGNLSATYVSDSLAVVRGGLAVMPVKPTSTTLIAGLLNRERELERNDTAAALRGGTVLRKNGQMVATIGTVTTRAERERERRATLPIASTSLGAVNGGAGTTAVSATIVAMSQKEQRDRTTSGAIGGTNELGVGGSAGTVACGNTNNYGSSPRYSKMSSSSGSLGIANIITNPGDYPRKSKGPICLTAAEGASKLNTNELVLPRKPRIDLFKKVIIVDDTEIYDCLDLIDVVIWPNEEMRSHGGRISWKEWEPSAGMVGYVVHCWTPNHTDPRCRSHVNRIVYLVEIGENYVPVEELGLREYNQIMGSSEEMANSRRSSLQREFDEFNLQIKLAGLTPILGSSVESNMATSTVTSGKAKIKAVSSSSSEDDDTDVHQLQQQQEQIDNNECSSDSGSNMTTTTTATTATANSDPSMAIMNFNIQRRELLLNMWKLIADKKKDATTMAAAESTATATFEQIDYTNEFPKVKLKQESVEIEEVDIDNDNDTNASVKKHETSISFDENITDVCETEMPSPTSSLNAGDDMTNMAQSPTLTNPMTGEETLEQMQNENEAIANGSEYESGENDVDLNATETILTTNEPQTKENNASEV